MLNLIEKIFSPKVLLVTNLLIILIAELSGELFDTLGLIRIFSFFFVGLGFLRIFVHYKLYDQYLQPLIFTAIASLIILAGTNFLGIHGFEESVEHEEMLFVNSVNLYIVSMLVISFGVEFFLRKVQRRSALGLWILGGITLGVLALALLILKERVEVSLEPDQFGPYGFLLALFGTFFYAIAKLIKLKKTVLIMKDFANYYIYAFMLFTIGGVLILLYQYSDLPEYQITYIFHFLFYGALSMMYLAFAFFKTLPGLYQTLNSQSQ
jgi:hypothetical protein